MNISRMLGALCGCVISFGTLSSHVELHGRLPLTPGGTDFQAAYDEPESLS